MGKKVILSLAIISFMLLFAACGSSEKASKEKETKPKTTEIKSEIQKKEKESVDKEEETKDSGEILNPAIAEETEGNVEVIYTNNQPNFSHEMDGFKVNVEEYQIVQVTDMNPDVTIPFKNKRMDMSSQQR